MEVSLKKSIRRVFIVHFPSGTHCSDVVPQDLVSDGNRLHISFSSNDKVVDTGFSAAWKAVDPTEGTRTGYPTRHWGNSLQGKTNVSFSPLTHTHRSLWRQLQQCSGWNHFSQLAEWLQRPVCVHVAYHHSLSKKYPCSLYPLWAAGLKRVRKLCGLRGDLPRWKHDINRLVLMVLMGI